MRFPHPVKVVGPNIIRGKMEVHMDSDHYFNNPGKMDHMKEMGMEPEPVDVFGAMVPQDKSLGNLKKMEESIRERFDLGKEDE